MARNNIGKVIRFLREERGISIKKLCRGLCSESMLMRYETGERLPDSWMAERLLGRLGKSMNQIEQMMSQKEYGNIQLQMEIGELLEREQWDETEHLLSQYEIYASGKVQQQFVWKIRAFSAIRQKQHEKAEHDIRQALNCTVPDFELGQIEEYCLSGEEVLLIVMWIRQQELLGKGKLEENCRIVLQYMEKHISDDEEMEAIFPKIIYIYIQILLKQGKKEEALDWIMKAKRMLTVAEKTDGLLLILQEEEQIRKSTGEKELYQKISCQKHIFEEICRMFGYDGESEINIWRRRKYYGLYLMPEMLVQERKKLQKTQEQVADLADLDQKTVSRMENGVYAPKTGTLERLREVLEMERSWYHSRLDTEQFFCLEIQKKITRCLSFHQYDEAEKLIGQLEKLVDGGKRENRQYIRYIWTCINREQKKITPETAIKNCREAFALTRREEMEKLDGILLGRTEVMIVNYMARQYAVMGDWKRALEILEKLKNTYENSKVDLRFHYSEIAVIYSHLSFYYEKMDDFEKAEECCMKGIRLDLSSGRMGCIAYLLMQYACIQERKGKKKELVIKICCASYHLYELLGDQYYMVGLQKYLMNEYHIDISMDCTSTDGRSTSATAEME